jgi:hypothetical protein
LLLAVVVINLACAIRSKTSGANQQQDTSKCRQVIVTIETAPAIVAIVDAPVRAPSRSLSLAPLAP